MSRRLLLRLLFAAPPATDHVSDVELLRRFVGSNDSAALELVVRRHADAVWAACRRVLGTDADAEDAFQATFLVLLRKARAIRTPSAGGWLHRVAVNAALKLRARNARTSTAEPGQFDAIAASPPEGPDEGLAAAVHEELAQLSERERLPVVLCDLEGLTHEAAAAALGWPVGTVSGRLSRARAKLRQRLARRGLTPAGALLPALAAPPHLIPNAVSLTTTAAPVAIASLAEEVLAVMTTTTWKWATAAVACVGALGVGGVLAFGPGNQPAPPRDPMAAPALPAGLAPPAKEKSPDEWLPPFGPIDRNNPRLPTVFPDIATAPDPDPTDPKGREKRQQQLKNLCPRLFGTVVLKIEPNDDALQKLLKARLHQGTQEFQRYMTLSAIQGQTANQNDFIECLSDMRAAATELWSGQPKQLVPWLEELLVVAKDFERYAIIRVLNGSDPPQNLNSATRHRLKVEAELWKAKRAP